MQRTRAIQLLALLWLVGCELPGGIHLGAGDGGPALDQDRDIVLADGSAAPAPDSGPGPHGDPPMARLDAAASEARDAATVANSPFDAGTSPARDAAIPAACTLEAGVPLPHASCHSELCSMDGETWLLVTSDAEPWRVGGLDWVAAVCERVLGWPRAASPDNRHLAFALSEAERASLVAGAPVLLGWGNPGDQPSWLRMHCELTDPSTVRACPIPPRGAWAYQGCRGPLDDGCAICQQGTPSGVTNYLSASGGATWYNVSSIEPGACGDSCPSCAFCSYRDEESAKSLERRDECLPCPAEDDVDPCFGAGSCACWCSQYKNLQAICPDSIPW